MTPEEREFDTKLSELADLEKELIQKEFDLETLQAELHAFEREYIRVIGVRYAELDDLEAQIAEYLANLNPKNSEAQKKADKARADAQDSYRAIANLKSSGKGTNGFKPSDSLKKLFRGVAKSIHPDLSTNEEEKLRRQRLMVEANQAYSDGDEDRLRAILNEWEHSPESIKGDGIAADLIRTIRKIAQIRNRLINIHNRIETLIKSDLYQIKHKVANAKNQGQDLLGEMAAHLDEQIEDARTRLYKITRNKK